MRDTITDRLHRASLLVLCLVGLSPTVLSCQTPDSVRLAPNYWPRLTLGVTTSILLHEAGHIVTSFAVGGKPAFGFDELRPTIFSGIDSHKEPRKQFYFSISGLVVQSLLDEGILDIPHHRGGAFERGLLAGGIGTTVFYLTIGRRGSVSDVDFIARTRVMNKTQVTWLFGGIAAAHTLRIARNSQYAYFFARPRVDGGLDFGWSTRR